MCSMSQNCTCFLRQCRGPPKEVGLEEKKQGSEGVGLEVGGRVDQGLTHPQKKLRELLRFAPVHIFSDRLIEGKVTIKNFEGDKKFNVQES